MTGSSGHAIGRVGAPGAGRSKPGAIATRSPGAATKPMARGVPLGAPAVEPAKGDDATLATLLVRASQAAVALRRDLDVVLFCAAVRPYCRFAP